MGKFSPRAAIDIPKDVPKTAVAVLAGGGLQSAILTAYLLEQFDVVYPVYVRLALPQERAEEQNLRRFLSAIRGPKSGRLTILEKHEVNEANDREQKMISSAFQWCSSNGIKLLATGALDLPAGSTASADKHGVRIIAPFAALSRASILELGRDLPLQFTFSCNRPVVKGLSALHCGQCIKCQMRKLGLAAIQVKDATRYAA